MGCSSSRPADAAAKKKQGAHRRDSVPPMTKKEIDKRIDSIDKTCAAKFGGVSVRYAYLSQRGYYPDDANKANQDAYAVSHDFANRESDAFFGVFDGHGRDGDKCAIYARKNLPKVLAEQVKGRRTAQQRQQKLSDPLDVELSKEATHDVLLKSHEAVNNKLRANAAVDDSLSGTTSISMYLHGSRNRITISNVGDSRAVIGRVASGAVENGAKDGTTAAPAGAPSSGSTAPSSSSLKAFALSRDQTPYRRDERVRIRKTGARILSLDQIEGLEPIDEDEAERDEKAHLNGGEDGDIVLGEEIDEGGDPPRVWSPNGDYPGTAFTRSIGDSIAEALGVVATPEMLTRELTPDDKIIVLASDGVFEFLTNQSVIDICAKFTDPLEACRAVVAESYELWLQYELRTDDITMICIFVDDVDVFDPAANKSFKIADSSAMQQQSSVDDSAEEAEDDLVCDLQRPVRMGMSTEKSRYLIKQKTKAKMYSVKDVTEEGEEDFDVTALYSEKTDEQKASIAEAIRASVVFQNISDAQRELIYKVMEPMEVKKGQWIIKQGTVGDRFFIVDEGSFAVRILPEDEDDSEGTGGNLVHVYEGSRQANSHPSFGELALMYSAPRAASIIAQTDGHLWALHRYAYKKITAETDTRKNAETILKKIDVFRTFTPSELKDVSSYLCEAKYGRGDIIIQEGVVGDALFIICPGGSCESVRTNNDGRTTSTTLSGDDFFGDEILKGGGEKKYTCTVISTCKSTCLMLQKSDVKRVMRQSRGQSQLGLNMA